MLENDYDAYEEMGEMWLNIMVQQTKDNYGIDVVFKDDLSLEGKLTFMKGLKAITDIAHEDFIDDFLSGSEIVVGKGNSADHPTWTGSHNEGTIRLFTDHNKFSHYTVIHELFHFIDFISGRVLTEKFMDYIGAKDITVVTGVMSNGAIIFDEIYSPGPENPSNYSTTLPLTGREDLAESAEEYFLIRAKQRDPGGIEFGKSRWKFIHYLITRGEVKE